MFPWCEEFNFSLKEIFTTLKIVNRDKTRRVTTAQITSMTEIFKSHKECSKPRTVLIEGEPGMGKTTYCQKLAYDWAEGQEMDATFPDIKLLLFLKCREMSGNIWEAINDQLLPKDIEEEAKENFFKYIHANQSQVLLVLDGLDEAPATPRQIFSDLVESRELPKCHILLTSRHEGGVKVSKYCDTLLETVGFAEQDSKSFILRYFKDMEALGQNLLREIECKEALKELTVNPLTTALLCLLCEDFNGDLPSSRTHLYVEITNCVLRRFRRKKGLPDKSENLTEVYKDELERLGRIALKGLKEDKMSFEENELGGSASEIPVFEFLSVQTGSSKRCPSMCYGFSHKSFQDFFAGFYLSSQISKGEIDFESLLVDEKVLGKLEQALLFAIGNIGLQRGEDALCLLKTLTKKANVACNSILESSYLCFALKCISECSTINSRLRAQMLDLIGTGLELQWLIISHNCDVQSLAEALKANATVTKLEVPSHAFGDFCATCLAGTLCVNKTLSDVNLSNNIITARGAKHLVNALVVNTALQGLNVSFNFLHDDGARIFAEFLKGGKALLALNLSTNCIGNPGATSIAESLQMNTTLKFLDLSGNPDISNPGAVSLSEVLKVNRTLTCLNLSGIGIGDKAIRSLSESLKVNTSLTSFALSDVKISAYSVRSIAEVIRVNSTLNGLEFSGNKVSVGGARLIAESLKFNTTLKYLNLSRNNIRAPGAQFLSEALKVNSTLAILGLSQNAFGARGAQFLSEGLGVSTSLTQLDLSRNDIGTAGAQSVAEALRDNGPLACLNLSTNVIGDTGAKSLSEALKANITLTKLDLSRNCIGATGAESMAEALRDNAPLAYLNLSTNAIGDTGAKSLAEALKANTTLTNLDLSENGIQTSGVQAFAEVKKSNDTLNSVFFLYNDIGDLGLQALSDSGCRNVFLPPIFLVPLRSGATEFDSSKRAKR